MIKLVWKHDIGECLINIPDKFKNMHKVDQLDYLGDAISELSNLYDTILTTKSLCATDEENDEFWENFQTLYKKTRTN
jgi:hypothetical protein